MTAIINTTRTSAFILGNETQNPLAITTEGAVIVSTGAAITGNNSRVWTIANAGVIRNGATSGSHSDAGIVLQAGGNITNTGSISGYHSGIQIYGGAGTITNYAVITGTLDGIVLYAGGSVTNLAGGTISGEGKVGVTISGASNVGVTISGGAGTVTNAGTIIGGSSGAVQFAGGYADRLIVDPGAVFVGAVTGGTGSNTLELAAGTAGGASTLSGLGTSFAGFGSMQVDADTTWTLASANAVSATGMLKLIGGDGHLGANFYGYDPGAAVTNAGTLANAGTLLIEGGYNTALGVVSGLGATLSNLGVLFNTGLLTVAGGVSVDAPISRSGALSIDDGGLLRNSGTLTNAGTISVTGGAGGDLDLQFGGYGGTLSDNGTLTNIGTINVSAGYLNAPYGFGGFGGLVVIGSAGVVANSGTINLGAVTTPLFADDMSGNNNGAELTDSGVLINQGVLNVSGASDQPDPGINVARYNAWLVIGSAGSLTNSGTISGGGVLLNQGLLSAPASAASTISVTALLNDGTIVSSMAGDLSISSAVSAEANASGTMEIASGGTVALNGSVAASQTIAFEDTTGTLRLGDPGQFAGTIVGLAPGDQLDLTGLPYAAPVLPLWAIGTLSVTSSGITDTLAILEGTPGSLIYLPSEDSSGGTLLSPHRPVVITSVGTPGGSPESVSGTANPDSTVSIAIGQTTVGTATADAAGDWTLSAPSQLVYGTGLGVVASEQGGGTSEPFLLTYNLPLVITQVGTPGGSPESVSGTADPNGTIVIMIGAATVGIVTADAAGDWTLPAPPRLVYGTNLEVVASEDGVESQPYLLTYLVPVITDVTDSGDDPEAVSGTAAPDSTVVVTIDSVAVGTVTADTAGNWTLPAPSQLFYGTNLEVIAASDGTESLPYLLTYNLPLVIDAVGTPGGSPESVAGSGDPDDAVVINIGTTAVGTVTADATGNWTLAAPLHLVYGTDLNVVAVENGITSQPVPLTYHLPLVINQVGTPGGSPESVSGTADPDSSVTVTIGDVRAGTAVADAAGDWTLAAPTQLVYGTEMQVVASQGGRTSMPVPLTYHNNLEVTQDSINAGAVIIDGTADPSEAVFVTLDGTMLADQTVADDSGDWNFDLGPLNPGPHTVVATVDDRGAEPTASAPYDFTALCFCAGTRIATPDGTVPVEQLVAGDLVLTHSGCARPIVWIGVGRVAVTRGRRSPATPVIVRKGALADNVPHQDLRVTKGHGFYFDDVLIPVEFLVNHRSILWDDRARTETLYHIELESHDILLANGAPAESYRDDGNRWLFRNANSGWDLPPQQPCAPVLTGEPIVDAIWRHLLDRAGRRPGFVLTAEPDLHLEVDGRRLDAVSRRKRAYCFRLHAPPAVTRVVSRAGAPSELGLARDPRVLGVAIRQIGLAHGTQMRVMEASDLRLADGFHAFEADNDFRWTNGNATLPVALFDDFAGPIELVVQVGATARYIADADVSVAA